MKTKLSPEATEWLFKLLMHGETGMPHAEYRLIDTGENVDKKWHQELRKLRGVEHRAGYSAGRYRSFWVITPEGIAYLKEQENEPNKT